MVIRFERGALLKNRYKVIEQIGRGGNGVVYKCEDVTTEEKTAVTFFEKTEGEGDPMIAAKKESDFLKKLHGIHGVPKFFKLIPCRGHHEMVMKLQLCDLLHSCENHPGKLLPESTVIAFGLNILTTLEQIHAKNIVHRDIKIENVMIKSKWEAGTSPFTVVDFGLAIDIKKQRIPDKREDQVRNNMYATPRMNDGEIATRKDDLVMLFYTMLSLRIIRPFFNETDEDELQKAYKKKTEFEKTQRISSVLHHFFILLAQFWLQRLARFQTTIGFELHSLLLR